MASPSLEDFKQHSERIVRKFLQTIMVVDDRAYFEDKESTAIPTEVITPGPPRFNALELDEETDVKSVEESNDVPLNEDTSDEETAEKEPSLDKAHELNAKSLIENFAQRGMVCAVIRPKDVEVELLEDKVYPLAENCDIVMFDWVLYDATDGGKVKELISEITKRSSEEEKRLRLIVVYTGQLELADITEQIKTALEEAGQLNIVTKNPYTLETGPVRIAVYAKGYVPTPIENEELAARIIPIEQLPDKLISEFADMTMGLVPNVAVESMAALRSNTHRILTKFHSGLDAPFLAHRAMLPQPEDADSLLVYLLGAELTAVLEGHEVGKVADNYAGMDVVRAWIEMHEAEMHATKERGFANKFSIKNTREFIDDLCKLLRDGFEDKALPEQFVSMKDKPHKAKLTEKLSRKPKDAIALEYEFAALTTLKSDYRIKPPALLPGTILKEIPSNEDAPRKSKYWVCIQPACDCVRIEKSRSFPFLELARDDGNFNLVLPDNNDFIRVRVVYKPYKVKSIEFDPSEDNSQTVRGVRQDNHVYFTATDGTQYLWIAELKFEQAQRIINRYATIHSRVGLDESEWLRRSSKGKEEEE